MTTFEELREGITVGQQKILNKTWQHFYDSKEAWGTWINSGILYAWLGKGFDEQAVYKILQPLGGTVIFETPLLGGGKRYVLTALGVLLTDAGPEIEYVLSKYLESVKGRYIETEGRAGTVSLKEIAEQFGFTPEQLYLLKRALCVFHGLMGGGSPDEPSLPLCKDELVFVEDFRAYVQEREFRKFDPDAPIDRDPAFYQPKPATNTVDGGEELAPEVEAHLEHKIWMSDLTAENFLAVYDVVLDIRQKFQLADVAIIPLQTQIVRPGFNILLPANTVNMRDRNCELRWGAVDFLKRKGIMQEVEVLEGDHRWDSRLRVYADIPTFNSVAAMMDEEYERRTRYSVTHHSEVRMTKAKSNNSSPWKTGSFYLVAFVILLATIAIISRTVPLWVLPLILIGGIFAVTIIGAFQLRHDNVLNDKSFLALMGETLKRLPLLRKFSQSSDLEK